LRHTPQARPSAATSGRHGDDVRAAERRWHEAGVSAVPAVIINDKYLISGGQPAAAFERALRSIAGEAA
jgi:predicted DsbA family dithiol-disulfide isomerase